MTHLPTPFAVLLRDDPLAAWFIAEIADRPFTANESPALDYACAVLRAALNRPYEQCLQLLLDALQRSDNRETLARARKDRAGGALRSYQIGIPTPGGSSLRLQAVPRPVRALPGEHPRFLASLEDVTALHETMDSFKEIHKKYQLLFELFPVGITITDHYGKIVEVNPSSEKILGLGVPEHTGRLVDSEAWHILRSDGSSMPPSEFAATVALKQGLTVRDQEMGYILPNGEVRWLSVTATPLPLPGYGVVVVYLDITERREKDAALRVKDRRYRHAVEAGKVCLWEWDIESGAMLLHPLLQTLLGHSPDELCTMAHDWLDLVHPEDRAGIEAALQQHLRGETPVFECEHRKLHKDGSTLWMLSRGVATRKSDGSVVLSGSDMDITQRKIAEQAVENERRRLFSLLDRLPALVCLFSRDACRRFTNRCFRDAFGSHEALAEYEAMHAGQDNIPGPLEEIFETRSLSIWEWRSHVTGRVYQMYGYPFQDENGDPLALELGIDITSSKKAQEALLTSEQLHRNIADNLALGLALLDQDMRVRTANPMFREWFSHADFAAAPLFHEILPDTCGVSPCPHDMPLYAREDGAVRESLLHVALPHGERTLQMTYCPVFKQDGGVDSIIVMADDVTDKLEAQAQLQRAQKLEALGTLATGIAHEINQPLNALQLYASGLEMLVEKDRQPDRETLLTRLGWIMRECGRIHEIITHMRALVRQESGPSMPSSADLNHCVQEAISLLQAQLKAHGITLLLNLPPRLPLARANPVQLEQVVINLVVNAMQALDAMAAARKTIHVSTETKDKWLLLRVADNGPGLQGLEERIFDPFFTSKEAGKGMGLGLSLVHTFVDSWGGEIRGKTQEQGGACFTVRLLVSP